MRQVIYKPHWAELPPIERIQLQVAHRGLVVNRAQMKALALIAYLSGRLELRGLSESPCDHSTRLVIEIHGARLVDVDTDGGVEMHDV